MMKENKELENKKLEDVSGGYKEKIVRDFNTGDVFISKNGDQTYIQVQDNYYDVQDNDQIFIAMYCGINSSPIYFEISASTIINDFNYLADALPW